MSLSEFSNDNKFDSSLLSAPVLSLSGSNDSQINREQIEKSKNVPSVDD